MNPTEKANALIEKMKANLFSDGLHDATQCAIIAVNEILTQLQSLTTLEYTVFNVDGKLINGNELVDFWQSVQTSLQNR